MLPDTPPDHYPPQTVHYRLRRPGARLLRRAAWPFGVTLSVLAGLASLAVAALMLTTLAQALFAQVLGLTTLLGGFSGVGISIAVGRRRR